MRVFRFVAALSLAAGLTVSAGSAMAQESGDRLNDDFDLIDTKCNDANTTADSFAEIDVDSDSFDVDGSVVGVGTNGDDIQIDYETDLLNRVHVDDKQGKLSQKEWSRLCVEINSSDPNAPRYYDDCINVEKCKIDGSVRVESDGSCSGNASVTCSGTDLFLFLDTPRVTSVQAAFPKGNECGVKLDINEPGKKSSIKINLKAKKGSSGDCIAEGD